MGKNDGKNDGKKEKKKKIKKNYHQDKNKDEEENILLKDERFQKAATHPKFSTIKDNNPSSSLLSSSNKNKNYHKTVIDERFSKILTDDNFQSISITKGKGTRVDKYGKKIDKKKESREELSAFYTLKDKNKDNDDNDDNDDEEIEENKDNTSKNKEDELDMENPEVRIAYLTALSRGEIDDSSSSSEDESDGNSTSSSESGEEEDYEAVGHTVLNPLDDNDEASELIFDHASRHVAILNLDWSNMRAMDILVMLSSFAKTAGDVRSISIYPSNFGLEQMRKEDASGPSGIWKKKTELDDEKNKDEEEENTDEDIAHEEDDIDLVKLRSYEASKLRYYFAVAEFGSSKALDHVYEELNGEEFEHSSVAIELRLIPTKEDLNEIITDRDVKEKASLPIPSNYNPPDFILDALQYTKVKCTWDEDDLTRRQKLTTAPTNDQDYDDLRAYLASDNSSDEEEQSISSSDEAAPKSTSSTANTFRKLLGLAHSSDESEQENDGDGDGEVQEQGNKQFSYVPEKKQILEQKIQDKAISKQIEQEKKELTPWDKYLLKRKEKRRERRQANKAKRYKNDSDDDDDDDDDQVQEETNNNNTTSKEELELLLAGDDKEEQNKDFNMRQLIKLQTKKSKKKNKKTTEEATTTSGQEFEINVDDTRFKSLFDGTDDRFGIDKTSTNFKPTVSMKMILNEQSTRRKKRRKNMD